MDAAPDKVIPRKPYRIRDLGLVQPRRDGENPWHFGPGAPPPLPRGLRKLLVVVDGNVPDLNALPFRDFVHFASSLGIAVKAISIRPGTPYRFFRALFSAYDFVLVDGPQLLDSVIDISRALSEFGFKCLIVAPSPPDADRLARFCPDVFRLVATGPDTRDDLSKAVSRLFLQNAAPRERSDQASFACQRIAVLLELSDPANAPAFGRLINSITRWCDGTGLNIILISSGLEFAIRQFIVAQARDRFTELDNHRQLDDRIEEFLARESIQYLFVASDRSMRPLDVFMNGINIERALQRLAGDPSLWALQLADAPESSAAGRGHPADDAGRPRGLSAGLPAGFLAYPLRRRPGRAAERALAAPSREAVATFDPALPADISPLRHRHHGEDVYVIAAGPSIDFYPRSFFDGKVTIGVNRVYRLIPCVYVVMKEYPSREDEAEIDRSAIVPIVSKWDSGNISGGKRMLNAEIFNSSRCMYFDHSDNQNDIDLSVVGTSKLVVSRSTITSAIHLGAFMGAKNLIIVGHDCGAIDGRLAATGYYSEAFTESPFDSSKKYQKWLRSIEKDTVDLIRKVREVYGCNVISLNPFVNFGLEGHEYSRGRPPGRKSRQDRAEGKMPWEIQSQSRKI